MTTQILKSYSDEFLTEQLEVLSKRDLTLMAEIVTHIHEFMVRRLYLNHGYTSISAYLTEKLGYPRATAQNRIDAARLLEVAPEIGNDLATGKINLGQITIISVGIREAEKQTPGLKISAEQKIGLIEKLKSVKTGEYDSARVVAQALDIKIPMAEKVRVHHDGSVTIEVHLSKEEFENLKRVRDLNSHRNSNAKLGETVAEAAKFFLEKKDPLKLKTKIVAPVVSSRCGSEGSSSSNLEASSDSVQKIGSVSDSNSKRIPRKYLSVGVIRAIHQRDKSCRSVDPVTGEACGSTYLLQIDHIKGLADGGGNGIENLQLMCAIHNRRKFELERMKQQPQFD